MKFVENKEVWQVKKTLQEAKFEWIRSHRIAQERGTLCLEWYGGSRGVVLVQWTEFSCGCQVFVDWATGSTFHELEAYLRPPLDRKPITRQS